VTDSPPERSLGYRFSDPGLLEAALTHRSWTSEQEVGGGDNERLEFLGDAVLYLVVSEILFARGEMSEGDMTKVRAGVVDESALASVAVRLGLDRAVRLGPGEEAAGGRRRASILADAMEAVLAAILLDGGIDAARGVIEREWGGVIEERAAAPGRRDFKTRLQERLATDGLIPVYTTYGEGPDHDRRFHTAVTAVPDGDDVDRAVMVDSAAGLPADALGTGTGTSKKRAEQAAAGEALAALDGGDA
jgi:ribonuclease-3